MDNAAKLCFADQMRSAREAAIKDGEAFDVVIHAVERLGSFLHGKQENLGAYKNDLNALIEASDVASVTPFSVLFKMVKDARNDALHQGAFARHLTVHSIELALCLEGALRNGMPAIVENYMVRNPTCAELWQPVSMIRQQMLANSFSFMPVKTQSGWRLVSDSHLAVYLRNDPDRRKERMARRLDDSEIELGPAKFVSEADQLADAAKVVVSGPALVHHRENQEILVGILTAFDLL